MIDLKFDISYGIPQGSVFGSLSFTFYVNDLSDFIAGCVVIQYANETHFIHTGCIEKITDMILRGEESLKEAKSYFHKIGLMLNASKTQCMFVGSRGLLSQVPLDIKIQIDGNFITPCKVVKNQGIYFDNFMLFNTHTSEMSKKIHGAGMYINKI